MIFLIVKDSAESVNSLRDMFEGGHVVKGKGLVMVTPSLLNIIKDTHEYLSDGSFSKSVYFENGKLSAMPRTEVNAQEYEQDFYSETFSNITKLISPANYGKVLESVLNIENKPSQEPQKRTKRTYSTSTKENTDTLSERIRGAIVDALSNNQIPTISDGKREMFSFERDIAADIENESQRNKLRKILKEFVEVPRFKTLEKWSKEDESKRYDLQDWLTSAKEQMGVA